MTACNVATLECKVLKNEFPTTVRAAVDVLLKTVAPEEQIKIPKMCREGLFMFQFSLGSWI